MGFGSDTPDHDAEAAEQAKTEADVQTAAPAAPEPVIEETSAAGEVIVEKPLVKLVIAEKLPDIAVVDDDGNPTGEVREGAPVEVNYPLTLSVASNDPDVPNEYVFTDASTSFEVPPEIADQVGYVSAITTEAIE